MNIQILTMLTSEAAAGSPKIDVLPDVVLPVIIFAAIGAIAGTLLMLGSKFFAVKEDETVAKITEALPNANCGACGYAGCADYAKAVAAGEAENNKCKPGGSAAAKAIAEIMGQEALETEREVAYVRCNGCKDATEDRYVFISTQSCSATERFYNGKGMCRTGCDGLGDCAAVCDNNAICIVNGVAVVNPENCVACGKCVKACPNNLIVMRPYKQKVDVRCSSKDMGKIAKDVCKNSCIGCKICEKKCPAGAITVTDNHASIDYSKCTNCGVCAAACPRKCIENKNGKVETA